MNISNYLPKMIDWESYHNAAGVIMRAPFREVVYFKRDAQKAGLDFDSACLKYVLKNYEKTTATDRGGYPKYRLKKKPEDLF